MGPSLLRANSDALPRRPRNARRRPCDLDETRGSQQPYAKTSFFARPQAGWSAPRPRYSLHRRAVRRPVFPHEACDAAYTPDDPGLSNRLESRDPLDREPLHAHTCDRPLRGGAPILDSGCRLRGYNIGRRFPRTLRRAEYFSKLKKKYRHIDLFRNLRPLGARWGPTIVYPGTTTGVDFKVWPPRAIDLKHMPLLRGGLRTRQNGSVLASLC